MSRRYQIEPASRGKGAFQGAGLLNDEQRAVVEAGDGPVLVIAGLVFGFKPTGNALAAVLTALPLLIGLYGFGLAFAALVLLMREANTMVDISSYLVQLFSGSNFPVNALPRWLLPVALALPLTYGFDATRGWLLHTQTLLPIWIEIARWVCIASPITTLLRRSMQLNRVVAALISFCLVSIATCAKVIPSPGK